MTRTLKDYAEHRRNCASRAVRDYCRGHGGDGGVNGCPTCQGYPRHPKCDCGLDALLALSPPDTQEPKDGEKDAIRDAGDFRDGTATNTDHIGDQASALNRRSETAGLEDARQDPPSTQAPEQQPRAHVEGQPQAQPPLDLAVPLVERITEYLAQGGLFSPDAMDHDAVQGLLMECREFLRSSQAREQERQQEVELLTEKWKRQQDVIGAYQQERESDHDRLTALLLHADAAERDLAQLRASLAPITPETTPQP